MGKGRVAFLLAGVLAACDASSVPLLGLAALPANVSAAIAAPANLSASVNGDTVILQWTGVSQHELPHRGRRGTRRERTRGLRHTIHGHVARRDERAAAELLGADPRAERQ